MNALAKAQRLVRRRARRDEGGYLLIYVLGIIGLTSVLVIALLGLALTSARVASLEARLAKEARAADGALESQVADVAGRGGDVCGDPTTWPRTVAASAVSPAVEVDCTFGGVSDNPTDFLPGPDVEIVGTGGAADRYTGGIAVPAVPGVSNPNFVVAGSSAAATFSSDVFVKSGAGPNRGAGTPAVDVAGQYQQGDQVGGAGCGALGTSGPHQITDAGGAGQPTCGSVEQINVQPPYVVDAVPTVLNRPMSCPSVSLVPGRYTPGDISKLNAILSGNTPCTVVFQPGVHYLDVFDASRTGEARNILTISNKNAKVIGGVPTPTMTFPNACESGATARGVRLVLSARSAIRHTGGNVALCPEHQDGSALPVLEQSASADTQPTFDAVVSSAFTNSGALAPGSTGWATTTMCGGWFNFGGINYTTCPAKSFATRWTSAGSGPLTAANVLIESQQWPQLQAWLPFDDPGSHHSIDLKVQFTVSGTVNCTTELMPAGRSYGGTIAYPLLNNVAGNTCAGLLTDQAQLNGAVITTSFQTTYNPPQGLRLDVRNVRLQTNVFTLTGASAGTSDAAWGATVAEARTPNNNSASVAQSGAGQDPTWLAGGGAWAPTAHVTRTFSLNSLGLPPGLNATDRINRLAVMLRGPANELSYLADPVDGGLTKVELLKSTGEVVCSTPEDLLTRAYGQSNQYQRFDLITPGNCASLQTVDQLQGLNLRVSFRTGCAYLSGINAPVIVGDDCASVPIPKVDSVSISVGTDSVSARPPYSSVSVDVADQTSFDAFGPVLLPRSDLDVRWVGTTSWPSGISRPVFEGKLQLHGLGVQQLGPRQGVVCCVVGRDAAVLVARVNGEVRAQAAIRVNPAVIGSATSRRPVEVLSWKLCSRVGC